MTTLTNKKFLTSDEAAAVLGLSPDTVRRYCNHATKPRIKAKKAGRDWRIPVAELKRFRANQKPVGRPSQKKSADNY